jgi:hypothetical protein
MQRLSSGHSVENVHFQLGTGNTMVQVPSKSRNKYGASSPIRMEVEMMQECGVIHLVPRMNIAFPGTATSCKTISESHTLIKICSCEIGRRRVQGETNEQRKDPYSDFACTRVDTTEVRLLAAATRIT